MPSVREQLAERLGIDEVTAAETADLAELRGRLRSLAPEALLGDPAALEELDVVEDQIAEELRRVELAELAREEEADRARLAVQQQAEQSRTNQVAERADLDAHRDAALAAAERALDQLVESLKAAIAFDDSSETLRHHLAVEAGLDPYKAYGGRSNLRRAIESRVQYRLRGDVGKNVFRHIDYSRAGADPLVAVVHDCILCRHERRQEIDEALTTEVPLRELAEKYGVSKSTLSRHRRHGD
jgi:hypothetical protein